MPDDRLRLVFTCCHPALAVPAQVALTLRLLGGLTTAEIARGVPRAGADDGAAAGAGEGARSATPASRTGCRREAELPDRLPAVLAVVYLIFTEGHRATSGERLVREDLCAEAIRLGRLLAALMPDEPEVAGLLALMLLTEARRPARDRPDGDLVLLADQDRAPLGPRADRRGAGAGARGACGATGPGPYQLQAAINAVHSDAADRGRHRLAADRALYDQLLAIAPSPVVALNRAVAVAEVDGPAAGAGARGGAGPAAPPAASTPCGPTCCGGWAGTPRRPPPTTRRSRSPATTPSGPSSQRRRAVADGGTDLGTVGGGAAPSRP